MVGLVDLHSGRSAARLGWALAAGMAVAGCGRTKPVADAAAPPSTADAGVAAKAATLPPIPLTRLRDEGSAGNHMLWVKDFDRQKALTPPASVSAAARALVPPGEARVVAWGVERHMALNVPRPGRYEDMIRVATPARGATLRAAVARHLERLGYPVKDKLLRSPMRHPTHGVLSVQFTEKSDLAARVEFTLARVDVEETTALADPLALMHRPMAWLEGVAHTPLGYELQHFHAVRFKGAFTDAQRTAYAVRVNDVPGVQAKLAERAEAAGFIPVSQEASLYRTPDGRMFTTRTVDEPGVLVLHVSERWPVTAKKPAAPASADPVSPSSP